MQRKGEALPLSRRALLGRALGAILLVLVLAAPAAAGPGWEGGFERLRFQVGWAFVPAGTAVIQARSPVPGHAEFRIEACTNDALDVIHKVHDRIITSASITDQGFRALYYRIIQNEGGHHKDKWLRFDEGGVVHTRNLRKDKSDYFPVPPDTVDVLTALFETRRRPLEPGESYRIPVFDEDESYTLVVEVEGRERLDTVLGEETPVLRVHPRLKSQGVFRRKGTLRVWFTDDQRRIPVRMESRIAIGAVHARLEEVVRGRPDGALAANRACE